MDTIFILLICVFLLTITKATSDATTICTSAKCSLLSPETRFPFRIKGLQPQQCGLPYFNLFCRDNETLTIHFPTYGDLVVKSISYDTKRLNLLDPKSCVHEVFLNLNLSLTPFSYYYVLKDYKYITCSAKLDSDASFVQVPCLSGLMHHVYVVESDTPLPGSCKHMKTVAIPFSYSPYLNDNSFGLGLTWNDDKEDESSGCNKLGILCEKGRLQKYLKVTGIIITIIFMAGILLYANIQNYAKESNHEEKGTLLSKVEIDKLLGEYETLNHSREVQVDTKVVIC